ncbi:hypothetical protein [Aquimarina addita]
MKTESRILYVLIICIAAICTQCASGPKIETVAPLKLLDAYVQPWASEVEGGKTGFTVHFFVEKKADIILKEIYYKGKKIELQSTQNLTEYIGQYTNSIISKKEIIMSSDPMEEFNNQVPLIIEKTPFELEENECIIEYIQDDKKQYFKLGMLPEKEMERQPTVKPE